MVVVSGNWAKNVATYPSPDITLSSPKMTAQAVLICRPNSHPFQERTLILDQPVKVGRSVARARATATNAIFDCKVLSRHHALLWYENGKFYLQDTKSSNGTFVNNNRLAAETEHHEVSSGDIVQFGVDVIENNRKVTHGCIIATLKLYLPDGKEAKASPSIVENNTHVVPLDELYKLHQVIQEATQREQCLESKLSTLQNLVDEARKSAEESWQAYVGEERLLSRVSVLETQLQQATKNWGEDKFREEISKLQEESSAYQVAAKEALEKLHAERLDALKTATEQERSRISAEQEALITKEQLEETRRELEEVALKLQDEQKKAQDERKKLEEQQFELQARLDAELEKVEKLQSKLISSCKEDPPSLFDFDKHIIYNDDLKAKEEMIENEICESENRSNGVESEPQQNHINLTVVPVADDDENKSDDAEEQIESSEVGDKERHVSFNLPEDSKSPEENEKDDFDSESVDSKTLKYKYQSAQNELKRKIEILESILETNKTKMAELEKSLEQEKENYSNKSDENQALREELLLLQQQLKENCNETQRLKDQVDSLLKLEVEDKTDQNCVNVNNHCQGISATNYENLVSLEEELVLMKERYAQVTQEKTKLQNEFAALKEQYNKMCNTSYDKMYFYMAPLILMILYLVISAMIS